LFEDHLDFIK